MDRLPRHLPYLLFAAALAGSAALILALSVEFTFFGDTWATLMERRDLSFDTVFAPHNEHINVMQVLLQRAQLALFGMSSTTPELLLLVLFLVVVAILLFVYVERRIGPWPALLATSIVLFLGPAWEVLLWPFEIGFIGSMLFGLAMLLALERNDRRGDLIASACLLAALAFSSLGIPFVAAAAADVLLKHRERGVWQRAALFAVPVLLFGLWYLGWGSDAESHLSLRNVLASPRFVADLVAFGVACMAGLGTSPYGGTPTPVWGYPLVIGLLVAVGLRARKGPFPTAFWVVGAAATANWFLTAFNQFPGRAPITNRYVYATAIFVLLLAANALVGLRWGRQALVAAALATLIAISVNVVVLKDGANFFRDQSVIAKANVAAIEIARRTVEPDFQLTEDVSGTPSLINVYADKYLEAVDDYGSPAYSPAELTTAPTEARRRADIVLSQALPLSALIQRDAFDVDRARTGCTVVRPGDPPVPREVRLSPGLTRIEVAPGPHADFFLRRFARREYPVPTKGGPGGSVTELRVPGDEAPRYPWYLGVEASQPVRVCG
ncbi:MAG TPA: hypothetical protein VNO20_03710 [Solirubrobacterales bacterium]|nr:hypothetical protein [Solirubrobacterales bacterium]